jgi:hypothetical protein
MKIVTLDPKRTHANNPDCPSRLVPCPHGGSWQCVDCGCYILETIVTTAPEPVKVREESQPRLRTPSGEWEKPDLDSSCGD